MLEGVSTVLTHTRDKEGFLASLAQIYYEILNYPERTQGENSDSDRSRLRKILKDDTMCVNKARQVVKE